ncbi:phospholipase A2 inhibitor and Ly6/PLAUR domain-containing protein-like [Polyodon spathula]|uniref:phospholipase A2 inhibitor and Ly6/PLAUR domain-containing protein-like n=1 Tax=Polyodon spathula TaxID=7913 RepID=UPI001B7F4773|nr:phospholipase A2 inhibitor and Ly6/PLAUR domain-containing protein-like [Polyodon spathula]
MKTFFATIIFGILLGMAYALTCNKCSGQTSCNPVPATCNNSQVCLTVSGIFQSAGILQHLFIKKCGPKLPYCNQLVSVDSDFVDLSANVKCCETDLCNSQGYNVEVEEKENGVQCPACLGPSGDCSDTLTTMCSGSRNQCISVSMSYYDPTGKYMNLLMNGCASQSACDEESFIQFARFYSLNYNITASCTSGFCPHGNMSILVASVILAFKVVFI